MSKIRQMFRSREIFVHDGAAMKRVHVSGRTQISAVAGGFFVSAVALFGLVQTVVGASEMSGAISNFAQHRAEISRMEARVAALQADVGAIRQTAKSHVANLEARQAFLAAMLKGEGDPQKLSSLLPARLGKTPEVASELAAMFDGVNAQQLGMADQVRHLTEARYRNTATMVARLGIAPARFSGGMTGVGGPYEPVPASTPAEPAKVGQADPQFRALFNSWKRLDQLQTGMVAIPSMKPVEAVQINSGFGVRSDPFRGGRAMHAGVDIPGAYATPIYATADGVVGRTGWVGGYGNLVELEHGRGIQTRYGHLSSIMVQPGARVKRGQLVALMGSTGRSTGNHLHYEVRIDGHAVNPVPFLQTSDYLLAMQQRAGTAKVAVGGPAAPAGK